MATMVHPTTATATVSPAAAEPKPENKTGPRPVGPDAYRGFIMLLLVSDGSALACFRDIPDGLGSQSTGRAATGKPYVPGTFSITYAFTERTEGSFGNVGQNTVRGPGLREWDVSLMKYIIVPEKRRFEIRAERFNIANHANFLLATPGLQKFEQQYGTWHPHIWLRDRRPRTHTDSVRPEILLLRLTVQQQIRMYSPNRRDFLKLSPLFVDVLAPWPARPASSAKRVIVAGAGLAGLACACEPTTRGHEVTVLEASARAGGHVLTFREGLADGLYADGGAQHFTSPGYQLFRDYVKEFNLEVLPYPHRDNILTVIDGRMIPEQEALSPQRLRAAGYNSAEIDFLHNKPTCELDELYLSHYMDRIKDEYQPFGVGLDSLDDITVTQLLTKEGASAGAIRRIGSDNSALQRIWKAAILRLRGQPSNPNVLFRLKGGNEMLPSAFATRLQDKIRKNCSVGHIQNSNSSVTVTYQENGSEKKVQADYLVCCMSALMLRKIPVTPAWPDSKQFAINNMPYSVFTRLIFQSKTKFWERDGYSGNMEFGSPLLGPLWPMAQDVPTQRGLMIGDAQGGVSAQAAYGVFKKYYPGHSADIDHITAVDWVRDQWAMGCETGSFRPGELHKFWPAVIAPVARVYFAG